MPASLIIVGFSLALFLYWFRYTCVLILSARTAKDFTARVAQTNGLELVRVQAALKQSPEAGELTELEAALRHDYYLLTALVRHAARFQISGPQLEQRILIADFQVQAAWFQLARRLPGSQAYAQAAVNEMADIVAHFANAMGERAALRTPRNATLNLIPRA